jgi:hypothetical protein
VRYLPVKPPSSLDLQAVGRVLGLRVNIIFRLGKGREVWLLAKVCSPLANQVFIPWKWLHTIFAIP